MHTAVVGCCDEAEAGRLMEAPNNRPPDPAVHNIGHLAVILRIMEPRTGQMLIEIVAVLWY